MGVLGYVAKSPSAYTSAWAYATTNIGAANNLQRYR